MSQGILRDEWWTPDEFFRSVERREGPFDLDAAASALNSKCRKFFTVKDDSLNQAWFGTVWCNPPYRKILKWVKKAHLEVTEGRCSKVVLLLPSHTSTEWFHYALKYGRIEFIKGKLKFGGCVGVPFWGSVLVVFEREAK